MHEQLEGLRKIKVVLTAPRADVPLEVEGVVGKATMAAEVYNPILDFLADHQAKTLEQIQLAVKDKGVQFAQTLQAAMMLAGAGHLFLAQDEPDIARALKTQERLNDHLLEKARGSGDVSYLACAVTGGGIIVGRIAQLFILALRAGKTSA